jgi:NAD(P)-dependent dehydrogenase (short-subunit alcohol dehydrogenase family)
LITGGTGALGNWVTTRFLEDGHAVAVTYRDPREWESLASEQAAAAAEGRLVGIAADVTAHDSMGAAVEQAAQALGGLRVLVHLAGGYRPMGRVEALEEGIVRAMLDLNLLSAFWAAKHVLPHVRRTGDGRLLFVSSRGAVEHYAGAAPYAAAKLGLHALVGTLASELKGSGTTANAVLPSVIDTPANRASMPQAKHEDWVKPQAVASLLAYLASPAAAATSGALVPIYGSA